MARAKKDGFEAWFKHLEAGSRDLREVGCEPYKVRGLVLWKVPGVEELLPYAAAVARVGGSTTAEPEPEPEPEPESEEECEE